MSYIFILLISEILLLLLAWRISGRDIFSCSVLTLFFFIASTIFFIIEQMLWAAELYEGVFWLFLFSFIAMLVSEYLARIQFNRQNKSFSKQYSIFEFKHCNLLICLYLAFSFLYLREIMKMGQSIGFNDLHAIGEVKENLEEMKGMNPIVRQSYKFVTAACYIHSLIFANNVLLAKDGVKRNVKHLLPLLAGCIITFASGGRLNIFKILIGFIFIFYIILKEERCWLESVNKNVLKIFTPIILAFIFFFMSVGHIVKNNADQRDSSQNVEYIAYYIGSPIQVFNLKMPSASKWKYDKFGGYTLAGLKSIVGIEDKNEEKIGNGMIYIGGNANKSGNAQTIFGGFFFDFGFVGCIVAMFLCYYLFNRYYYKNIVNSYTSYKRNKSLIIYAYFFSFIIALSFYDNTFYLVLSQTGILTLIVLLMMYYVYFKKLIITYGDR